MTSAAGTKRRIEASGPVEQGRPRFAAGVPVPTTGDLDATVQWMVSSLFAIGMDLASASTVSDGEVRQRLQRSVAELDGLISQLRASYVDVISQAEATDAQHGLTASP